MQTRDQKLAAAIFKQVKDEVKPKSKEFADSYGAMAHKLPVLIRTSGLAQALAFVDANAKSDKPKSKACQSLLTHLAKIVCDEQADASKLLERSRNDELEEYMRLTQQTMAALLWYKRFAQSVLGVTQGAEVETTAAEK